MCQWAANRKQLALRAIEWVYPWPPTTPRLKPPKQEVEKFPFQISASRLEVDDNVNRARAQFRIPLLAVKWCSFRQSPKWVNADRAQYGRSSRSPPLPPLRWWHWKGKRQRFDKFYEKAPSGCLQQITIGNLYPTRSSLQWWSDHAISPHILLLRLTISGFVKHIRTSLVCDTFVYL